MSAVLHPSPALPTPLALSEWAPAPAPRLPSALAVLGLHALGVMLLWQGGQLLRERTPEPVQVALIQEHRPPAARPAPAVQAPTLPPALQVPVPEVPIAPREPSLAAQPLQPMHVPQAPAVQAAAPNLPPTPATLAPAAPVPKAVASSSLRWRVEPAVELPRLSRRAGEQGRVLLRVVFDASGAPRDIQLQKSSGFPRLDAQAFEALRVARITPFLEDGRPIEVVATAVLDYELE